MGVLGINDSANSGSSLANNGELLFAVNEERFTGLKNDVGFPYGSIKYIHENSNDDEIDAIALGWIGGNALFARLFPGMDEKRRKVWRREADKPSRLSLYLSNSAYGLVLNQRPRWFWKAVSTPISTHIAKRRLSAVSGGLASKRIYLVEHHTAHAASAYYTSGFKNALVVTLDGSGDGISGSVSIGDNGELSRLTEFKATASLGIFYGAATVACDMRYGEDEGKLMSLAAYSYPAEIKQLEGFPRYNTETRALESRIRTARELYLGEYMKDHILSRCDRESFAYAVQKHVEREVLKLVGQWVKETKMSRIALAGGFFSNVKVNSLIEHMDGVKEVFVFPNMGDGGLSTGAAAYIDFMLNGKPPKQAKDMYTGPSYTYDEIERSIKKWYKGKRGFEYDEIGDPASYAAELIADKNKIVLWFQGRMEFGPRALGNRSVLALPNYEENRNILNLIIKKRPYYQPFASTVLEEEADSLFEDYVMPNRFMTSANVVRKEHIGDLVAASHIDHTTRPQTLGDENPLYRKLIKKIRRKTGIGAILNTSLNKHGKPIVMKPEDAFWTLENTGADTLVIGNFVVSKKKGGRQST
jgi:carbamoyltransferase